LEALALADVYRRINFNERMIARFDRHLRFPAEMREGGGMTPLLKRRGIEFG
jgi:hypothetical protein